MKRIPMQLLLCAAVLWMAAPAVLAQDAPIDDPDTVLDATQAQILTQGDASDALAGGAGAVTTNAPAIGALLPGFPLFQYQTIASRDGSTRTGRMVGLNPMNRGARTTHVTVVHIPLRINFNFSGAVRSQDPTVTDPGCLGDGNTAYALTGASPLFNNVNWMFGPTNVGNTQFPDAFQRGEFWTNVVASGGAYHLIVDRMTTPVQTINLAASNTPGSHVANVGFGGQCGTNVGTTNLPGRAGLVDINVLDPLLRGLITTLGVTNNQFPFFEVYDSYECGGACLGTNAQNQLILTNCCILGYHNYVSANGQTYGIGNFEGHINQTTGNGTLFGPGIVDVSIHAHEMLEWVNDPLVNNGVPAWGGIGQVGGCQGNLEVGDPLTGTNMPTVALSGFNYHLQELAFYNWFMGGPSRGVNGWFSSNGTFAGAAKACPPGGTN